MFRHIMGKYFLPENRHFRAIYIFSSSQFFAYIYIIFGLFVESVSRGHVFYVNVHFRAKIYFFIYTIAGFPESNVGGALSFSITSRSNPGPLPENYMSKYFPALNAM